MPQQPSTAQPAATPVDLPLLSANFPLPPDPEVMRSNVINTLRSLVQGSIYAIAIEGRDGIGKTTVLSQFARRFPETAVSIFISAANRLSSDIDLIRYDIATQIHWILNNTVLQRSEYDPLLLKTYYSDLQRHAKNSKSPIYFVVDGLDELDEAMRSNVTQQLSDTLPIGIPLFRFIFSGD